MAEDVPVVQNWKLLLVAAALAVLTVIVYNVHINKIRADLTGNTDMLLRYKHSMKPGDKVKVTDVEEIAVQKDVASNLGNVLRHKDLDFLSSGDHQLFEEVASTQFIEWQHLTGVNPIGNVAKGLPAGWVAVPIKIDPESAIGSLRPGAYVHILAVIGNPAKLQMVMRYVRVFEVGAKGARDPSAAGYRGDEGMSSYRNIAIELPELVAIDLVNALSHATGAARIQLPNPVIEQIPETPKLEPAVKDLAKTYLFTGPS